MTYNNISFDEYIKQRENWFRGKDFELCNPPIKAQFALDLIFKALINDKEQYQYLTTMPESVEQTNDIMLYMILYKYSRNFRKYLRKRNKE